MPLCLVYHCLLYDHPHYVLVIQVLLGEFQRIEDLLPLGRDVLAAEGAVVEVEGDRCVFLEGDDF